MRPIVGKMLLRALRRDPAEIARRSAGFDIRTDAGRSLVASVGNAFLGGFNAMLSAPSMAEVASEGSRVEPHFRPFFFEGAAMGYAPRGYIWGGHTAAEAERSLITMHPAYRYLYYVGLGFWHGIRHGRVSSLTSLQPHVDSIYFPLCYDGFGFKMGFYDYPRRPRLTLARLGSCPQEHLFALHQGFGRALYFVFMDDEPGLIRLREAFPAERRRDLEFGRSLALAFTRADQPEALARHLTTSTEEYLTPRLAGVTWALTAREMNDAGYFARCLGTASPATRELLAQLPRLCLGALQESSSYLEWQTKTSRAAAEAFSRSRVPVGSGS